MTCDRCGTGVSGNYCSQCGAAVRAAGCPSCGTPAGPGDRFCTQCGTPVAVGTQGGGGAGGGGVEGRPVAKSASASSSRSPGWWVATFLLAALIFSIGYPAVRRGGDGGGGNDAEDSPTRGLGPAPQVDLNSMTPIEAADRLYDRVTEAANEGDSVEARTFLPMAIAAYERAKPLSPDGIYHLSTLQLLAMDREGALATAAAGLAANPDHLLILAAAAAAASELGDTAAARRHYTRILEVYDAEVAKGLQEYEDHGGLIPSLGEKARRALGSGG